MAAVVRRCGRGGEILYLPSGADDDAVLHSVVGSPADARDSLGFPVLDGIAPARVPPQGDALAGRHADVADGV